MKLKNRFILLFTLFLFLFTFLVSFLLIPKEISVIKGEDYKLSIKTPFKVNVYSEDTILTSESFNFETPLSLKAKEAGVFNINFDLMGILPVKANLKVIENEYVYPSGQSCGVKILTDGVLVISVAGIKDFNGNFISPAKEAGITAGDFIKKVNGKPLKSTRHLTEIIKESKKSPLHIQFERNGQIKETTLIPAETSSENYVIGMWVRDSTAGLGTLTFYTGDKKSFAALGHSITDVDTGELMKVRNGELVKSTVIDYKKGEKGNAGELIGIFEESPLNIGKIYNNSRFGLFGKVENEDAIPTGKPVPVGLKSEVTLGGAKIISTIENNAPEEFEVEIIKINNQTKPDVKGLVIKVTDKKLIEKTGGIVQGMSGSPILQNGRIVGAVTHVFVNDPTRGYGIFIENMLAESEKISD